MTKPTEPIPVAWMTFTEEGDPDMVFLDRLEACQYCEDDDPPKPLYLAAPPTAQAEGWVSVDERLPAKNTEVLICFAESPLPSTGQYTGHAEDPAGWCYPKESYLWPGESEKLPDGGAPTVTHWMTLPLPPTSAEGVEHG